MTIKNYSGILRQLSFPEQYDFYVDGGERIEDVRFKGEIPLETNIEITLDDKFIVDWYRLPGPAEEYCDCHGELVNSAGETRKHITMFLVRPEGAEVTSTFSQERIDGFARQMQNVVREFGEGKWNVEVRGYAIEGTVIRSVVELNRNWYQNWLAENDPDFRPTYIGVRSGSPVTMCGNAFIGGNVFYTALGCPFATDVHEVSHAFGLHHAGWGNAEYGDQIPAWMGNHSSRDKHTAPHMHQLGLLEEEYVQTLSEREVRDFYLVDWDTNASGVKHGGVGEHKLVYIRKSEDREHFAVSFAKGQVWVHRADPMVGGFAMPGYRKTWGVARLREPGHKATFGTSPASVEFRMIAQGAGVVRIRYDADDDMNPGFTPDPHFILPQADPIAEHHRGLWGNPEWNHQGLTIYPVRDEIAGAWYTWTKAGRPIWIQFQGPVTDGVANLMLHRTSANRVLLDDGDALLYFTEADEGWFKYNSHTLGRGAIPLTKTATLAGPLTGFYDFEETTREGISVIDAVGEDGKQVVFGVHYGYQNGQIWRPFDGSSPDNLTVYEAKDGYPNIKADSTIKPVGTAALTASEFARSGAQRMSLNRLA